MINFTEEDLNLLRGALWNFRNSAVERLVADDGQKAIYQQFIEKADKLLEKMDKVLGEEEEQGNGSQEEALS